MTRAVHLRCLLLFGLYAILVTCSTQIKSKGDHSVDDAYIAGHILTRPNAPFKALWLESNEERSRRSSYNSTTRNWPHDIPYIMDSSYTGDRVTFRMVLDYISSKLCVTFHDVTSTWDMSNPAWLTQHGFKTNSLVKVMENDGCGAYNGQADGHRIQPVTPCSGFGINLHEMLHVLGVTHTQEGPIRDSYLTVNEEDIKYDLVGSYNKNTDPSLVNEYFDPNSEMMYGDLLWNRDGLETFTPIRDDLFHLVIPGTEEKVVFYELNQIYRCNELFCNNDPTDCGPGYHARVKGRCRCVCPDELDPSTNCRSFISGPTANLYWPNVPFALYGDDQCPKGFDPIPGWLPISGTWVARFDPAPRMYPTDGHDTLYHPFCVRLPDKGDSNWSSWPVGGQYCVVKPAGEHCGGVFEESRLEFTTRAQSHPNGSLGDITVNGTMVTINYCCRGRDSNGLYLELPNSEPFRLHPIYATCPMVRGMKSNFVSIDYWTNSATYTGDVRPLNFIYSYALLNYHCYYQPPKYGCSENITLTSDNPSVTVTTPGFKSAREPNMRCFYQLNVPKKSFIRVTFNNYDLHEHDQFLVRRYHKWQDPFLLDNSKWPQQIVSESDYLSLEYWASWETTGNKGANFTIDVFPAEKMCYDVYTKGEDYSGEKSITETYQDCIPWDKATTCDDFPFDGYNGISLLTSGNQCRNPNGALSQPWCYVFVRNTVCHKRYCDVCNLAAPIDTIDKCPALMTAGQPDFCATDPERFGCFTACNFSLQSHTRVRCGPPSLPQDVYVTGGLKQEYNDGETVNITCKASGSLVKELRCTKTGWSGEAFGCNGCPANWTSYGDRCFYFSMLHLTRRESSKTCASHDATATLFEVRNLADQQMIRTFKSGNGFDYQHGHWISGQLQAEYGEWLVDTGLPMTYFNWSNVAITTQVAYNCIKFIAEYEAHDNQGGWKTLPCDGTEVAPFMCQVDNSVLNACQDQVPNCSDVMKAFPYFCHDPRSVTSASRYCQKSCGICEDLSSVRTQCTAQDDRTYFRTSPTATVSVGQVMTFACKPNLYLVGGDRQRACSHRGQLLGSAPVCGATPNPVDIRLDRVRLRLQTLPSNLAFVIDYDGYRVPYDGQITTWYYYCHKPGTIYFLVYRHTGDTYRYVGSNTVVCEPNWVRSYHVPLSDQIKVFKDDVYGAFSPNSTTLSISDCDRATDRILPLPAVNVTSVDELIGSSSQLFAGRKCMVPSLGIRLEPCDSSDDMSSGEQDRNSLKDFLKQLKKWLKHL